MSDYRAALERFLNDTRKNGAPAPIVWRWRPQRATAEEMTAAEVEEYRRLVGHLWKDDGDIVEAVRRYIEPQPLVDEWPLIMENGKSLALMREIMARMLQGQRVEIIDPKGRPR